MKNIITPLTPLIWGLVLAWLLSPPVEKLKTHIGTTAAILLTYTTFLLTIAIFFTIFIILILGTLPSGTLAETAALIALYFHDAAQTLFDFSAKHLPWLSSDVSSAVSRLHAYLSDKFSLEAVASTITTLSGASVRMLLGLVASIYLIKDKTYFLRLWNQLLSFLLPQKAHGILCEIASDINAVLSGFIKGVFIDSAAVAFMSSIILSILGVRFAVILGILCGLFNVIPYFGPILGMIPTFLVAFFHKGFSNGCISVFALFMVQQIDSNLIYPRIVGTSTGIHPFFVLMSVSIAGYFFGLPGMLLAVPLTGAAQILLVKWVCK